MVHNVLIAKPAAFQPLLVDDFAGGWSIWDFDPVPWACDGNADPLCVSSAVVGFQVTEADGPTILGGYLTVYVHEGRKISTPRAGNNSIVNLDTSPTNEWFWGLSLAYDEFQDGPAGYQGAATLVWDGTERTSITGVDINPLGFDPPIDLTVGGATGVRVRAFGGLITNETREYDTTVTLTLYTETSNYSAQAISQTDTDGWLLFPFSGFGVGFDPTNVTAVKAKFRAEVIGPYHTFGQIETYK